MKNRPYLKNYVMPSASLFGRLLLCIIMTTSCHISFDYSSELKNGIHKVSYKLEVET